MRRIDRKLNMQKVNLLSEQRYLESKGFINESLKENKPYIKKLLREGLESIITEERIAAKSIEGFNLVVPNEVKVMHKAFVDAGHEIYVVGGAVRDALNGVTPKDWDLATDAHPERIMEILKTIPIVNSTKLVGERFGVIIAVTDNDEYEIATFQERDESNLQSTGEIDVKFSDMEGDISRRDLTINALFYDIGTDEVVDLVGGIDDVRNNVIRSVGKPEDRFEDDSIRKLRAIRFAARTGSKLDPDIDRALKNDPSIHPKVARIPINDEFFKGIKQAKDVKNYLSLLDNYDMWEYIVPPKFGINLNGYVNEKDIMVLLAVLFNNNNPGELRKKLSGKGDTMNYSGELANGIKYLIQLKILNSDNAVLFKKNQSASDQQIRTFARLMNLDMKLIEALLKFNLSVKGGEAMQRYGLTQKDKSKIGQAIKDLETEKFKELL